ncbi:trypsin-like serine protease [Corynebacterium tapiri]|uniref:S1 family peptidase n=1 Tax=Corynebacterium tapiri TaxID=1448266 RepID=A0A5C4U5S3_9CORY|nr:trypsin-like serine protease [Corynebacterium tapiri]TNL98726.1 S1 family peptidase [Corynebacterium tapiri]
MTSTSQRSTLGPWAFAVAVCASAVAVTAGAGVLREQTTMTQAQSSVATQATPVAETAGFGPAGTVVPTHSPWAPGTLFHLTGEIPTPGVPFEATECTVAFSFDGQDGRAYAVTASHCGQEGDLVFPRGGNTEQNFTKEVGRVIYSGLNESDPAKRSDVAIIEITDPNHPMILGDKAPVETLLGNTPPTGTACKVGGTTGQTCGEIGPQGQRYAMVDPETEQEVITTGDTAKMCAQRGDSGGPVTIGIDGRPVVIGLVSGTRGATDAAPVCDDPAQAAEASVAFVPMARIQEVIREVVPDARLTWS